MSYLAGTIVLAIAWAIISGGLTLPNLLLGAVIGGAVLFVLRSGLHGTGALRKVAMVLDLLVEFIRELVVGAVGVAWLAVQPNVRARLRPRIIAYPLQAQSELEIAVLANLITLTPGTLSVDVAPDRRTLFVHILHAEDRAVAVDSIYSGLEVRVLRVFR